MVEIFCVRRLTPELGLEIQLLALRDEYANFYNIASSILDFRRFTEFEQEKMAAYVRYVYARIDGYLAGFTVCAIDPFAEVVRTTDMFVARRHRRKGVARRMYEISKNEIRASTAKMVSLTRWPRTVTMLHHHGDGALEFWKSLGVEVYNRSKFVIDLSENMCSACERIAPIENRCTNCKLRTYCNPTCMRRNNSGCPLSCVSIASEDSPRV